MIIAKVGENLLGITKILVNIVEIGKQQFAPAIEMVETIGCSISPCRHMLAVGGVETAHQLYAVSHLELRMLAKQVANSDVGRAPNRLFGYLRQMLVEEQRSTLVRENHSHVGKFGAETIYDVLSHRLKE